MMVYVSFDGDGIGNLVGRASLRDDEAEIRRIANSIDRAGKDFASWAISVGGEVISTGGDEGRLKVPAEAIPGLPAQREKYKNLTGHSVSVGIGMRLSEADRALLVAKIRGKDRIVMWQPEMAQELEEVARRHQSEESKVREAYLSDDDIVANLNKNQQPVEDEQESSADPRTMIAQALMRIKEQASVLEQLKQVKPDTYKAVLGIIQAMMEMAKIMASGQSMAKSEKPVVCRCDAYTFPHRSGGGKCTTKPLEKVGMLPGQKRKTLRPGIVYPVHTRLGHFLKVQHGAGPVKEDGTTHGENRTGWIRGQAGLILSPNDYGNPHPVSSLNPSAK